MTAPLRLESAVWFTIIELKGIIILNVDPRPTFDFTLISPPRLYIIFLVIDKLMPTP
jgi:hypothetical protein